MKQKKDLSYCKYCKLPKRYCQCTNGEWTADYKSVAGKLNEEKDKKSIRQELLDEIEKELPKEKEDFFKTYTGGYIQCNCGEILQTEQSNFAHREHLNFGNHYFNECLQEIKVIIKNLRE